MNMQRGLLFCSFFLSFIMTTGFAKTYANATQTSILYAYSQKQCKKPSRYSAPTPTYSRFFNNLQRQDTALARLMYQQLLYEEAQQTAICHTLHERSAMKITDQSIINNATATWKQTLTQAHKNADTKTTDRLTKRIEILRQIKPTPKLSWHHAGAINLLIDEFNDAHDQATALKFEHPTSLHAQMATPLVAHCYEQARQEIDIEKAFELSDCAHNIVSIIKNGIECFSKAGQKSKAFRMKIDAAIGRGLFTALKTAFSPTHWKHLISDMAQMISNLKQNVNDLLDPQMVHNALNGNSEPSVVQQQFTHKSTEFNAQLKQTWNSLQEKPWNQVLESSVELGSLMVLDLLITHGATHATTIAGQKFIAEVAGVFKQEGAREAYCKEVATLGKALVEAEEQKTITTHQTKANAVITKRPKLQNLENVIELTKTELGETVFAQKQLEQVKYIETNLKIGTSETKLGLTQYFKYGDYETAVADFYALGPLDIKPLPSKEGLMGILYDGRHINVRFKSSKKIPTIEIQNGNNNYTKIRYGTKP